MSFGLVNASATFQRMMNLAMHGLNWEICCCYIDDVLVFSRSFDEHLVRLEAKAVFKRLDEAQLRVSAKKCKLAQPSLTMLGHMVSADGVAPCTDKVVAIDRIQPPKNVTELQAFLLKNS